jgi:hypothetical protein
MSGQTDRWRFLLPRQSDMGFQGHSQTCVIYIGVQCCENVVVQGGLCGSLQCLDGPSKGEGSELTRNVLSWGRMSHRENHNVDTDLSKADCGQECPEGLRIAKTTRRPHPASGLGTDMPLHGIR